MVWLNLEKNNGDKIQNIPRYNKKLGPELRNKQCEKFEDIL